MGKVAFIETTSAKLASLPLVEGRFTYVKDTEALYRDTATKRSLISGNDVFITISEPTLRITTTGLRVSATVVNNGQTLVFNV